MGLADPRPRGEFDHDERLFIPFPIDENVGSDADYWSDWDQWGVNGFDQKTRDELK